MTAFIIDGGSTRDELRETIAWSIHNAFAPDDGSYFASKDITPSSTAYAAADEIMASVADPDAKKTCVNCDQAITPEAGGHWRHDNTGWFLCERDYGPGGVAYVGTPKEQTP